MDKDIFCRYDEIKDDIVYETDNFMVKVGIGLIAPGQVMLIPRDHYDSFADLPLNLNLEFENLKVKIIQKITAAFFAPFLIEYGNCGTIQHAHVHIIPQKSEDFEINSILNEMVISRGVPHQLMDLKQLKENYIAGTKYILIEDDDGKSGVVLQDCSQKNDIHRRYFSEIIGLPAVHSWSNLTLEEKMIDQQKRELTRKALVF